ncbi:hypothetical protein BKA57DRAFT_508722 [Linnemannia elongata]|nr:hypothetical protein BKA57DRAFT_508722 [Linnemannia elongata]
MSSIPPSSWNPYQGRGAQGTATTATTNNTPPTTTTTPPTTTTYTSTTTSTSASSSPLIREGSPEVSTTASSAYSSWTVPSLDGLFSARRASAFGLRYGLSSVAGTMVGGGGGGGGVGPAGGRVSPAHSGMSMMMEGGSAGASLQIKARKMSIHMSETITGALNDTSLVFYRVNEHVHKKVPILVQEKKALVSIRKDVETANQDMEDARQTISSMQRITEFSAIEALVERSLAAVQK